MAEHASDVLGNWNSTTSVGNLTCLFEMEIRSAKYLGMSEVKEVLTLATLGLAALSQSWLSITNPPTPFTTINPMTGLTYSF